MTEETKPADTGETKLPEKDAAYWEGEAKKAFKARDAVKEEMRTLRDSGRVLSDEDKERYQTLVAKEADLAEKQKRAEGQFDTLKTELVTKHQTELKTRDERITALERHIEDTEIQRAFFGAVDWFGGDSAKTIFTPDMGVDVFRKYVAVKDENGIKTVVVKRPNGEVIHGADGNPAPFAEAIGELINVLPNKDRILRGSGKAGSGSSGGAGGRHEPLDVRELTERARTGDKDALKALEARRRGKGDLQIGPAFNRAS